MIYLSSDISDTKSGIAIYNAPPEKPEKIREAKMYIELRANPIKT